jgi:hypothetical protein
MAHEVWYSHHSHSGTNAVYGAAGHYNKKSVNETTGF